jgi:hypothetical protein
MPVNESLGASERIQPPPLQRQALNRGLNLVGLARCCHRRKRIVSHYFDKTDVPDM